MPRDSGSAMHPDEPGPDNDFYAEHLSLLCDSYTRLTGRLLAQSAELPGAQYLWQAPFVLLSHDGAVEPRFTYANRRALGLFEMSWREIIGMPSRYSAQADHRETRERLLEQVSQQGYIENYRGVRISKSGRRFMIENAIVWNLLNADDHKCGQAAMFEHWHYL